MVVAFGADVEEVLTATADATPGFYPFGFADIALTPATSAEQHRQYPA